MPNVFIDLSIQHSPTTELLTLKMLSVINLFVFYLKNGNLLSGGLRYSQVKMRTQSGQGLKPNTKPLESPPIPL